MKYFASILVVSLFVFGSQVAFGAGRPAASNRGTSNQRYTASVNQISGSAKVVKVSTETDKQENQEAAQEETVSEPEEEPVVDMREAERNACISNNIGVGNTFVWASKYSDTSNYVTMIEDAEHPENNVCFVRVELNSSNESRIKVSDIEPKYFMWDETIKCGSWVSKKDMEKRILDAKKGVRIGGIVASTVAGMGVGVGAMELFGNKLIGGKVEGQKSVKKETLYKNRLLELKKKGGIEYQKYVEDLEMLVNACDDQQWHSDKCSLYKELLNSVK